MSAAFPSKRQDNTEKHEVLFLQTNEIAVKYPREEDKESDNARNDFPVILLPETGKLEDFNFCLLSKGYKEIFCGFTGFNTDCVFEVDEHINTRGDVSKPLEESAINRALRQIYKSKHKRIFIALLNSHYNPLHEKILYNVLITAGYQPKKSSGS